jgi:signal transduction histidine kinase
VLHKQLGPDLSVVSLAGAPGPTGSSSGSRVGVTLRDGTTVTAALPRIAGKGPPASTLILGSIGFMVLNLAVLLWWATRGLTAPLTRFAQAAAGFSLDRDPAPLPERRPYEVRTAARALNRMRERIRRMVEDRTRMLAAVSHDLRTPITRLRLRAEFIEDETMRAQMLRDLDQMSGMVHAALSYLRDGQTAEGRSLVDLASLLQTLCDEFADIGHAASYEGPGHLLATVRSDEISRAVANLVENGVKWGTRVVVRLRPALPDAADIEVADDGPAFRMLTRKPCCSPLPVAMPRGV